MLYSGVSTVAFDWLCGKPERQVLNQWIASESVALKPQASQHF